MSPHELVVARRCALTINPFTNVAVSYRAKLDIRLMLNDNLVPDFSKTANLYQQNLVHDSLALVVSGLVQLCKISFLRIFLGRLFLKRDLCSGRLSNC